MNTDRDRELATQLADEWQRQHTFYEDADHQIPSAMSGAEARRIGMLGEFAFPHMFPGTDTTLDLTFRRGGGGYFDLQYAGWKVDVKTSTFCPERARRGREQEIRIPSRHFRPDVLYVAAIWDAEHDEANLVCWCWGDELTGPKRYKPGGPENWVLRYKDCHRLSELRAMVQARNAGLVSRGVLWADVAGRVGGRVMTCACGILSGMAVDVTEALYQVAEVVGREPHRPTPDGYRCPGCSRFGLVSPCFPGCREVAA